MASGKLFHQLTADSEQLPQAKKRKVASAVEKPRGVASQFRHTDVSNVQTVSKIFEGKEFCVVNGTRGLSKEDAERKIAEVRLLVGPEYLLTSFMLFKFPLSEDPRAIYSEPAWSALG